MEEKQTKRKKTEFCEGSTAGSVQLLLSETGQEVRTYNITNFLNNFWQEEGRGGVVRLASQSLTQELPHH